LAEKYPQSYKIISGSKQLLTMFLWIKMKFISFVLDGISFQDYMQNTIDTKIPWSLQEANGWVLQKHWYANMESSGDIQRPWPNTSTCCNTQPHHPHLLCDFLHPGWKGRPQTATIFVLQKSQYDRKRE